MHKAATLCLLGTLAGFAAAQALPVDKNPVLITPYLNSLQCLDTLASSQAPGTPIVLASCTGSATQRWSFVSGQIKLAAASSLCIEIPGGASAGSGTKLIINTCSSSANQRFNYGIFDYVLSWFNNGFCVDLTGGSLANGNPIQIWACSGGNRNQIWNTGYLDSQQPTTSEANQSGNNNCGTDSSSSSNCQTAWINDIDDFCLWAPPAKGGTIGDTEQIEVAWCTSSGHGTRLMPPGTVHSAHFVKTPDYVQVTGTGDFTKINIQSGDSGGELDPHGADGNGNPVGGLVFGNTFGAGHQYHEWTSFISDTEYCFRACIGPNAQENCQHIYDQLGCFWNMPANYDDGFETCDGDDDLPMGVYGTSTFHQGQPSTPPAHPAASSSNCQQFQSLPTSTGSGSTTTTTSGPAPTGHTVHPGLGATKCLAAASNTNGAAVTLQPCNGATSQQWTYTGTVLQIYGNKCLDVTNGSTANGNKMQIWSCTANNANQMMTYTGDHRIAWTNHGECLDLTGGSTATGNPIQMWSCTNNNNNQVWNIV